MRSEAERRGDALAQLKRLGRCSIPHACVLMNLHHHTLRHYVEEESVEAFWVGKRAWITQEEIDRYNREGKRTPNPTPSDADNGANYGGGGISHEDDSSSFFC
jgi:hypothetical protein